jgi:ATP-dependent Clp protease, protease subunit
MKISNSENQGASVAKRLDDFNAHDRQGIKFQEAGVYFLIGEITEDNINEAVKWLAYENIDAKDGKILTLYVNSQGGDLYEAFGLIDMMQNSQLPIRTIGYGSVMSAAFLIVASGTPGERYVTKNCGIMCHQMSMLEEMGKYHDIKATRKETDRLNKAMYDVLKETTGLDGRIIKTKLLPAHDVYMTAEEMIEFGAADHILERE